MDEVMKKHYVSLVSSILGVGKDFRLYQGRLTRLYLSARDISEQTEINPHCSTKSSIVPQSHHAIRQKPHTLRGVPQRVNVNINQPEAQLEEFKTFISPHICSAIYPPFIYPAIQVPGWSPEVAIQLGSTSLCRFVQLRQCTTALTSTC